MVYWKQLRLPAAVAWPESPQWQLIPGCSSPEARVLGHANLINLPYRFQQTEMEP